jgi:hypothetical protein
MLQRLNALRDCSPQTTKKFFELARELHRPMVVRSNSRDFRVFGAADSLGNGHRTSVAAAPGFFSLN